jgi:threonine aldolase
MALRRRCTTIVPDFHTPDAAGEFRQLAEWCAHGNVSHDTYGRGELVESFEHKIATLLGKPAAVFMPSGVMAQLAAVRIWGEAARLNRFGLHPTSHLALHEEEAYSALLNFHAVPVGHRLRPMTAADLAAIAQPLACTIVELPLREVGGLLPGWDDLEALKAEARGRGIKLHMDGARLWECAAHYDKTHAEIATGFDSVYVSLYKGIGAFAGAMLAGDEAFIAQARLWRRRMGGTLYHLSPMVAAAAMRFDDRLACMPRLYRRAQSLAAELARHDGLRVNPAVPQTNLFHLHFDAPADAVMDARDEIAERDGCWLFNGVIPTEVPGWSVTELYVGDRLLDIDDEQLKPAIERLCRLIARPH